MLTQRARAVSASWLCLVIGTTGCAGSVLGQLSRDVARVRTAMHQDKELFLDGPPLLCSLLGRPRLQLEGSLGRADVCGGRWIRVGTGTVSCAYYLYHPGPDTLLAHGTVFVVTYDASDLVVDADYYRE